MVQTPIVPNLIGFALLNYQIVKDLVLDLAHEGFELKTQNPMRVLKNKSQQV